MVELIPIDSLKAPEALEENRADGNILAVDPPVPLDQDLLDGLAQTVTGMLPVCVSLLSLV